MTPRTRRRPAYCAKCERSFASPAGFSAHKRAGKHTSIGDTVSFANQLDALVQALMLSVTAPDDSKSEQALGLATQIAHGMPETDVQRAKNIAGALLEAAAALQQARDTLDAATEAAKQAAVRAVGAGASEVRVADALGVNRLTVRRWLGK